MNWLSSMVFKGDQLARKIGFPTANLDPQIIGNNYKPGIYGGLVKINEKQFLGIFYFGPKHLEKKNENVLEVHILDFNENLYNQIIDFRLIVFIREPKKFTSVEEACKEIENDIEILKKITLEKSLS